ncbi:MAG TPA: hypothetical protein VGR93_08290 [Candidatus Acidoferrales bacterium]|nr:hypothetical protein [Candidatus Acidoferrales bacterium]
MSNGLFIQSYPAPGVEIVPASYTVGKGGYVLIATITVLMVLMVGPRNLEESRWLPLGLLIYFVTVSLALIFFRSFKLDVRTDGISYSNSFRGERFVAFAEMSTVTLFTNRWVAYQAAHGLNFRMPGTIVITPKPDTGKPVLKIPLWLFSDPAESQVTHLLRPEEWDTDS